MGGYPMIEQIDQIIFQNTPATEQDFCGLYQWLEERNFPFTILDTSYKTFLLESNGGEFLRGEREYQMFSVNEICDFYEMYLFETYMPYALPFAMDGYGNFFLFDMRTQTSFIYMVAANHMCWESEDCFQIAENFMALLEQTKPLYCYLFPDL